MSLLETFSKKFGFTTEEDDENGMEPDDREIEEEDVDEEEDEEPRFSFRLPQNPFSRRRQQTSAPRSRTAARRDEEEEDEDEPPRTQRSGNVIHDPRMSGNNSESQYVHCERVVSVRQINECRAIIKCLLRGESVLLNLENIDPKDCGRVVDLLSGAAFALQGRMLKVAHLSYLLAPENVEIIEGNLYPAGQARYR